MAGGHVMDQETLVYGVIRTVSLGDRLEDLAMRQANRNAILGLSTVDEFPYLTQDMFHLPTPGGQGTYMTPLIQFAASYQAVEYEWTRWLEKFERLLVDLYWRSAIVYLETELSGKHVFSWDSVGNFHVPGSA
ncbi:MAG: hypothetical protein WED11_09845, partial [Natronospirillum sp.]